MSETIVQQNAGHYEVKVGRSAVTGVQVADIDLVLTLANGDQVVLEGAGIAAMSSQAPDVQFADGTSISTAALIKDVKVFGVDDSAPVAPFSQKVREFKAADNHEVDSEKKQTDEAHDPSPASTAATTESAQPPATPSQDAVATAQKAVEAAAPKSSDNPPPPLVQFTSNGLFMTPPEKAAMVVKPGALESAPSFGSVSFLNLVGLRSEGATIYGSGGDAPSDQDPAARYQGAAEVIEGTSGNDVIYGDDPQKMGDGFAKVMQVQVNSANKINSFTVSGLPADVKLLNGTKSGDVWIMNLPAQPAWSNSGTFILRTQFDYPTGTEKSSFAFSFTITAIDSRGQDVEFTRTVTAVLQNVTSGNDMFVADQGTDYTFVLPLKGLSNHISGEGGNDTLYGSSADDVLDGGTGADRMEGRGGDDLYRVDDPGDVVVEVANAGTDTVETSISYTLSANVENLTLTGTAAVNGTGNDLTNVITGNSAANILDGGAGADTMVGGLGDDTYVVDNIADAVTENPGEGTDTVQASISYTLGDNVENLTLTGTAAISGTGNALANVITGNGADNVLDGGKGADTLIGGAGDDTYMVDDAGDVVIENAGEGTDLVEASVSYTLGSNVENLTLTGTAAINGTGNDLANVVTGNSAGNILDGGAGADTLIGATGDDTYVVDNAGDVVVENASEGIDRILSSVGYTLSANVENLTLTGNAAINAIGNVLDNVLTGNAASNILDGGAGADTMIGGAGDDSYVVDNANDTVVENAGEGTDLVMSSIGYALGANVENLTLTGNGAIDGTGNDLDNVITGNGGNNILDGGAGADTMAGGLGDDTYRVDNSGDVVLENAGEGTDLVYASASYTLTANVENLTLTGTAEIDGTGNDLDNVITGNNGANVLDGGAGADTMAGGLGDDTFIVDNVGDIVVETAAAGTDTVQSSIDYTLVANVENLTLTGTASINGTGNALVNTITGNAADNVLDGAGGADVMIGGLGNDTYVVDDAGDTVVENTGEGIDLVQSSISYVLGTNIEKLTLTGALSVDGTGNDLDNVITGNAAANVIDGGAGADTMIGGAGDDSYVVDDAGDVVMEEAGEGTDLVQSSISYTLTANVENLTLTGAAAIDGTGNGLANAITGNVADNILDGGAGADTMAGGQGDDTYVVDNINDVVTENAGEGTDLVRSSVTYTLGSNVENLTLSGSAAIDGTGNDLANTITGNGANNVIDGGIGADTMIGGAGDDSYLVDNVGDAIVENVGEGTDTVLSSIDYSLGANLENLTLTGTATSGTGNALANTITGNAQANILDGGAGADTMVGGLGNDSYYVDDSADAVVENAGGGTDTVYASATYALSANVENLTLTDSAAIDGTGNDLANTITGNSASNVLDGGLGADTMAGGSGDDTYLVDNPGDTILENAGEGTDTVRSSIDYMLGANLENLTLTGAAISGTGNALANTITGNALANILDGGAGADTMAGGLGNDTYYVDDSSDVVVEDAGGGTDVVYASASYALSANVENLTLTGNAAIDGTGNALNNIITGNGTANILDGGMGADTLAGGLGDDSYIVDNAGDTVVENAGEGTDLVRSSIDYTLVANVENLTLTGAAINGTGNALANVITGNGADNVLDGAGGADVMIGGLGNDTYVVDNSGDIVTENAGEGTDLVQSSVTYTLGANVENLMLTGVLSVDGTGNGLDNVITGNAAANVIDGGAGADTMIGGAGDDSYVVDNSGDVVLENAGEGTDLVYASASYTLTANVENLTLTGAAINGTGNGLANVITGNGADNLLDGGAGADALIGGLGNDTYVVDNIGDVVTENAGEGTDSVLSTVTYTLGANVENLTLTGSAAINGTGNMLANTITGNGANNVLDGGSGADTLAGGLGDDTYVVDNAGDLVTENAGEGTDTVQSSINYALGANVENLTLTGNAISGKGNALANVITGNVLANVLNGGAGADTMVGGIGDDTYIVDNIGDVVTENTGEGIDLVYSSVSYTLSANVENLTLTGNAAINGTGNDLANTITGNGANNVLDGGTGADTLVGGLGDDTYQVDNPGDLVTENAGEGTDLVMSSIDYTMGANVENLTLTGAAISGTGNALANTITGNALANILDGGAGGDTMVGGLGNDSYYVDDSGDAVVENAGGGTDTVYASATYALSANVENLTLTGSAAIDGTGNDLANTITGNSASNVLDGGLGVDTMAGGLGDDTYVIDNVGDVVTELAGGGTDLVRSSVDYTLGANLENLTLTGSAVSATGNGLANVITGNANSNVIDGGTGADTMVGGLGDDTYMVDNIGDVVTENANEGVDTVDSSVTYTLSANVENLTLTGASAIDGTGNSLANVIIGNDGANVLDGRAGADTLRGGAGDDTYVVDNAGDVVTENAGEGTDLVRSSVTYTLTANVENLTLTGSASTRGTGNALNNVITGNSGDNILDGGLGADTIAGGAGDDTYIIDNIGDVVTENANEGTDLVQSSINYTLTSNVENLTLTGTAISGTGNALANTITGNGLANIIDGGVGADTMIGGAGNDTYMVDNVGDVVAENAGQGTDIVYSTVTYTLSANVENLTLTGAAAIDGTGNSLSNVIVGNTANNVIDGGAGADTMTGGLGDDTYVVDNIGDLVTENTGEGTDLAESSISYTLTANVENLTLTGTAAINGTGNSLTNVITGNAADNVIDGGAGADTMIGGAGDDTYVVDDARDVVTENAGEGIDLVQSSISYTLTSNVENLTLTGTAATSGMGNALVNTIIGNSANNVIDGGVGADTLTGGAGDDTYFIDNIGDVVTENANEGTDLVYSSVSYTLSADVENLTLTGVGVIDATGNALANTITGNTLANVLDGGAGADTLIGGAGDDTYIVDDVGDAVIEGTNAGTDLVRSSVSYTLAANVENLTLTGIATINGTGNALNNVITGNSAGNFIDGGMGADTMAGGQGDDTYVVDDVNDVVTENANEGTDLVQSSISYALTANVENLTLTGTAATNGTGNDLNNVITGNSAGNVIDGGLGADTMVGGTGDDTYYVDNVGDAITENTGEGTDLVYSSVTYGLSANVENLTLTGNVAIDATGNALNNVIIGNSANNGIDGGIGADTMAGGLGDDTYVVDNAGDIVTENAGEGTDLVESSITYALTANVENLTLTGSSAIDGTGNALANVITGNGANNMIDGGSGGDMMIGGTGNDTYVVDNVGDVAVENANEGTDLINSSVTYTLSANVENLTLTGNAAINGTGNTLVNTITGNSANNVIDGGVGADTMIGGAGDDTYVVDNVGDVVTEGSNAGTDLINSSVTYTLSANVENLTLTGNAAINGTGNALANVITGNGANNTIDGGVGADTMVGGTGDDIYVVDNVGDVVVEGGNAGTDLINSSVTYTLSANVENLTLTGSSAINGTGNALANVITGNSANNTLDGGAGADTMIGGAGDDTYVVDNVGDVVTEGSNAGTDLINSSVTYTLSANVENLTLTGSSAINGTGNALANVITGNGANNVIDGGVGADTMVGGAGDDTYVVDNVGDVVTEGGNAGTDLINSSVTYTLSANVENLTLTGVSAINGTGNALANTITGNSADNVIDGGSGADTMVGGAGDDTYVVDDVGDVVTEGGNAGTDLVNSSVTYTLSANIENLTLTGVSSINGTGNALANVITGNSGDNVIDGGAGADTIIGGAGNDTYYVDNAGDVITENSASGTDLVYSSVDYTLGGNLENLTLQTGATAGTGNALNNVITGNGAANTLTGLDGNDTLDGQGGADIMIGGTGNDIYYVDDVGDVITENAGEGTDLVYSSITYTLGANVENLTLQGNGAINGTGSSVDNVITGNSAANTLSGLAGNDTLNGQAGADTMIGGTGNDTYVVDNIGDVVIENANEGTDLIYSTVTYTLSANVENLTLDGSSAINGTGNALANIITGNGANNVIDGGTGADTMIGGAGNDTYMVDNVGDTITENSGEGTDIVYSTVTYTLSTNVENLTLQGSGAIDGTGNTLNNVITANSGANALAGMGGDDTLIINGLSQFTQADGGTGSDTLVIRGLSANARVDLSSISSKVSNMETVSLQDNVKEFISISAATIQAMNGNGNSSALTLRLDGQDALSISSSDNYTVSGSTYTFYDGDPFAGGAVNVIATLTVTTA